MDIAALSMEKAQFQLQQQTAQALAENGMGTAEMQMQDLVDMFHAAAPPSVLGQMIDMKA